MHRRRRSTVRHRRHHAARRSAWCLLAPRRPLRVADCPQRKTRPPRPERASADRGRGVERCCPARPTARSRRPLLAPFRDLAQAPSPRRYRVCPSNHCRARRQVVSAATPRPIVNRAGDLIPIPPRPAAWLPPNFPAAYPPQRPLPVYGWQRIANPPGAGAAIQQANGRAIRPGSLQRSGWLDLVVIILRSGARSHHRWVAG